MHSEKKHKEMVLTSGIATPGVTRTCANVIFTGTQVKIMWKAKVNNQLLARVIGFMWGWSKYTGKTERVVFVAKNCLRSTYNFEKFSWQEWAPVPLADVCYMHTECAHAVPMAPPGYTTATGSTPVPFTGWVFKNSDILCTLYSDKATVQ